MPASNGTINFKIDTGADVTVVPQEELTKLNIHLNELKQTRKKVTGPGHNKLKGIGYTYTTFRWGDKRSTELIYICQNLTKALLGKPAINRLQIAKLNKPSTYSCNEISTIQLPHGHTSNHTQPEENKFIQDYPEVFNGLDDIEGPPINIELKPETTPYRITTPRHIPIPLFEAVKEEIKRMEKLGVIKRVEQPTDWCHPIVVAAKPNNQIRLCINLTKLNKEIEHELYQLEPVDQTIARLGEECQVMTKLDANSDHWQMKLDEDTQILTTFITPLGRSCCTRGPFGLSSVQEIFNKRMDSIIDGLPGVAKSTDDFLNYGKTVEEHDNRLNQVLQRFKDKKVTLNKSFFKVKQVEFLEHHISPDGVRPLTSMISAITDYPTPTTLTELRRFMGMAQQLLKFTNQLATAAEPLRELLSSKTVWTWTIEHENSFKRVK